MILTNYYDAQRLFISEVTSVNINDQHQLLTKKLTLRYQHLKLAINYD